ncbi:MAG: tetratricopeptide repeat protein [Treponema sp.]|jgi:tetratricopeptide (TPR) repeat protein|nr:tetratricopeptide repeat protein [Treponema sp.]
MKKDYIIGCGVIVIIAVLIIGGSAIRKAQLNGQEAERIADISNSKSPQTIDDLKKTITAYEKQLDQLLKASSKTATYWKILATRLQDRGQHAEALEALQNAIEHAPEDTALFYMTGISAGIMAKSGVAFPGVESRRQAYFSLAEESYLRSIELKPDYDKPLYAIGILYAFELDKSVEAIPYLEQYITLNAKNPEGAADAMFVLARAYYAVGNNIKAAELYDLILNTSKNQDKHTQAALLRQRVFN